jgi:glycine cleavage system H protein
MIDTPNHLKFTQTHEWINHDADEMTMGITDHAQHLLGDMVFVDLPQVGDEVNAGDEIGVVESVKAASDFYAPISGVVVAVNEQVNADPALVNNDPYGAGWLIKIKASNHDELNGLLDAEQYQNEIAEDDH